MPGFVWIADAQQSFAATSRLIRQNLFALVARVIIQIPQTEELKKVYEEWDVYI